MCRHCNPREEDDEEDELPEKWMGMRGKGVAGGAGEVVSFPRGMRYNELFVLSRGPLGSSLPQPRHQGLSVALMAKKRLIPL